MNKLAKSDDTRALTVHKCSACGNDHQAAVTSGENHFICPNTGNRVMVVHLTR